MSLDQLLLVLGCLRGNVELVGLDTLPGVLSGITGMTLAMLSLPSSSDLV